MDTLSYRVQLNTSNDFFLCPLNSFHFLFILINQHFIQWLLQCCCRSISVKAALIVLSLYCFISFIVISFSYVVYKLFLSFALFVFTPSWAGNVVTQNKLFWATDLPIGMSSWCISEVDEELSSFHTFVFALFVSLDLDCSFLSLSKNLFNSCWTLACYYAIGIRA